MNCIRHTTASVTIQAVIGCVTLLLAPASHVSAGIISTYTTRGDFDAAVGSTTLETFNSFTEITNVPVPGGLDVGPFTIQRTESFPAYLNPAPSSPFDIDGTTTFQTNTFLGHDLTIVFDAPITAFGADFAAFNDDILRTRILVDGEAVNPPSTTGNAVRFFGFQLDASFSTLTFEGIESDGFAMDNVSFASSAPVPEPSSLFLLAMGATGLAGLSVRRQLSARLADQRAPFRT